MTALVLENLAAWPYFTRNLRMFLVRFARALDALVSARAARAVPEWQARQVQNEMKRFQAITHAGNIRRNRHGKS